MSALGDLVHNAVRGGDIDGTAYSYAAMADISVEDARQIILGVIRSFKEATHDRKDDCPHREGTGSTVNPNRA
jgi:hypothetical protein